MNVTAKEFRARARASLQGNYWMAFLASFIVTSIVTAIAGIGTYNVTIRNFGNLINGETDLSSFYISASPASSLFSIISVLLSLVFAVGLADYYIRLADRINPQLEQVFSPFRRLGAVLPPMLLMYLFVFLWSLLFVIPGIIAGFRYAMVPYIVAEHPETKPKEALELSKKMMKGNCGKLFCLQLSFIGWGILCLLTAGIGFVFLTPYIDASTAEFFNEVSGKNYMRAAQYGGTGGSPSAPQPDPGAGYQAPYAPPAQPDPNAGYQAPYAPPAQPDPGAGYQAPYAPPAQPDPNVGYQPYAEPIQPDPAGYRPDPDTGYQHGQPDQNGAYGSDPAGDHPYGTSSQPDGDSFM